MINVYEPYKSDMKYVYEAIQSNWISSHGKYLNLIKEELKEINGNKYVVLCNTGTAATHLLAIGLKHKYPKITNLIVPNNVYVAAWNSFIINPIYNLIPVDCDCETWNIDLGRLNDYLVKYSPDDTAVLIVHNIGNIVDVLDLQSRYQHIFLEDNCEGFLGEYRDYKSGSKSLASSVSFFGNKIITSGEGGAVFTDDEELFKYLNSVRAQGSTFKKFIFDKIGYNYRMTNLQAAILYGQIKSIDEILDKKRVIFNQYRRELNGIVEFQRVETTTKHSNWMVGIKFKNSVNEIALNLYRQGVDTRPMFYPMSYHKHLKQFSGVETNAKFLSERCLILPSYPNLDSKDISYITGLIKSNG